ncbi:MAG: prepilin peptidase [Rhodospirillales bacterium]|nr:prepilin peptidase [Rhodospirillales bacterium]
MTLLLTTVHWLSAAAYPLALAYAVVSDSRRLIIPNGACIVIAAAFLSAALAGGFGLTLMAWHFGVGAGLFGVGLFLFSQRIMGGGDVKLLAAVGIWVGWGDLWPFLYLTAILGGGLALCIFFAGRLGKIFPFLTSIAWMQEDAGKKQPIPYGVAIGLAAIIMFSKSPVLPAAWGSALGL